eukprot:SAG11_NODE_1321_length_5207_cov_66.406617_2_plen_241_part_00
MPDDVAGLLHPKRCVANRHAAAVATSHVRCRGVQRAATGGGRAALTPPQQLELGRSLSLKWASRSSSAHRSSNRTALPPRRVQTTAPGSASCCSPTSCSTPCVPELTTEAAGASSGALSKMWWLPGTALHLSHLSIATQRTVGRSDKVFLFFFLGGGGGQPHQLQLRHRSPGQFGIEGTRGEGAGKKRRGDCTAGRRRHQAHRSEQPTNKPTNQKQWGNWGTGRDTNKMCACACACVCVC